MFTSARSVVTILAQLAFTPVIVSLYPPEAYGVFGFIVGLVNVLLPVVTLQYDKALFLARNEQEIAGLRALSNLLPLFFALVLATILLFARSWFMHLIGAEGIGNGILLVPILLVVGAWSQNSQRMVQVRGNYKENFLYGSAAVVASKLLAISYGVLIGGQFMGLALAEFFNRIVQHLINDRFILKDVRIRLPYHADRSQLWSTFKTYIGFPKFELPSVLVGSLTAQLPLLWLPGRFGMGIVGQYALALSLLEMPMRLFGYSISGTFYQKAVITYREQGTRALSSITLRMMRGIFLISIIPIALIAMLAQPTFSWIFGPQWSMAGAIAAAMTPYYLARLVVEPVGSVLRVVGRQRAYLLLHGANLIGRVIALMSAVAYDLGPVRALFLVSLASTLAYMIMGWYLVTLLGHTSMKDNAPTR